ncbi:MAG: DUF4179 domain-containing protein [Anaerostipes sp.]|nr:DUF4179 domain-containing protein [Anaerostipes sp.]
MRNNEERVAAVKRRSKDLEQKRKKNQGRMICLSAIASCLALIVGISLVMPDVAGDFSHDTIDNFAMTASVFQGSGAMSYIIIGLLAFALGVCVTILCYQINRSEYQEKAKKTQKENDND